MSEKSNSVTVSTSADYLPTVADFPEAADLLNQLKARRKKSRADLADINAILGLLVEEDGSRLV